MRRSKEVALVLAAFMLTSAMAITILDNRNTTRRITASPGAFYSDTYVYAGIGEPQYLDPAVDYESAGNEIIQNVYETLVWWDRASVATLKPMLATEVPSIMNGGISADGLTYTFNLKPGVRFHDGATMTADDVEYSFERVLRIHDPDGPSWMLEQVMTDYIQYDVGGTLSDFKSNPYSYNPSWLLDAIGGTSDSYIITERDVQNVSEAAVVKVDSDTVRLKLTHPYAGFLQICSYTVSSVVSKSFVEAHGGITNAEHNDYMDEYTCGTGPYSLVSWEKGSRIHMTRFASYHGTLPALKDAYVIKADDINTRILMLAAGDADSAYIPEEYESVFSGNPDFEITKGIPTFNIDLVGFNQLINATQAAVFGSNVPSDFFQQKNVRKAFTHLFDAQSFIDSYVNGNGIQPNGIIPAGMFGYNASAPKYDYNLTKAKELLENATNPATGHSWWVDGFTVAIIFNTGNVFRETASQYLKQGLESLNAFPGTHGTFAATVNALDWPTYLTLMQMKPSPMPFFFLGWAPDYADPDDYVYPFLYSMGTYPVRTNYYNSTIDSLVLDASSELNPTERQRLYDEITNLCYDDAPYIWLVQHNNFHIERSWVQGYYYNPMYGGQYYAALSKGAEGGIEVVKNAGSPARSAVSWEYAPIDFGTWTGRIVNNGLRSLVVEVYDITSGAQLVISHEKINFRSVDAYPAGTVDTKSVVMSPYHRYQITVTPNGPVGSSATVMNPFIVAMPPVAAFTCTMDYPVVTVSANGSYDPDGTIVSYDWYWGDGSTGEGQTTSHTYESAGQYVISLLVTDDRGMTDSVSTMVMVAESSAALSPPHSDHGVDSNGNGLYDYLALDVSIEVSVAGNFSLSVALFDSSWGYVMSTGSYRYISPGPQIVEVLFEGWTILQSGLDGPYIAVIDLVDQEGNWLGNDTHITQTYTLDQFQLPSAELAPPHSDHGLDTDSDGLFDYLAIDVSVSISGAGVYSFNVTVYDSSWNFINMVSTDVYLDPGAQTVEILFKGYYIYNSKSDGPYLASLELTDSIGNPLDSGMHVTQAYGWNQFEPPVAQFAPPHSDHGLDTDGNGLYDYLVIDVSLQVSVAGSYSVFAGLYDSWYGSLYVGWSYVSQHLESGLQTVQIMVPGYMIHDSGINGPYWAWLSFGDSNGYWLQNSEHYTQGYAWDQFQPLSA